MATEVRPTVSTDPESPIVREGDRMQMTVEFARALEQQEHLITVRVKTIEIHPDGIKKIVMERDA
jgi:hypothetical protein